MKGPSIRRGWSPSGNQSDPSRPDPSEGLRQIFDRKVWHLLEQRVGGGAVLPDPEAQGEARLLLQLRLREQAAEIARQQITAATLGEVRVARVVDEQELFAASDHGLMAFQDHMAIAPAARKF